MTPDAVTSRRQRPKNHNFRISSLVVYALDGKFFMPGIALRNILENSRKEIRLYYIESIDVTMNFWFMDIATIRLRYKMLYGHLPCCSVISSSLLKLQYRYAMKIWQEERLTYLIVPRDRLRPQKNNNTWYYNYMKLKLHLVSYTQEI